MGVKALVRKARRVIGGKRKRKKSRGVSPGFARYVGKVGFYEARDKLVSKGVSLDAATRIVGKAKGIANKKGWLKKVHGYGRIAVTKKQK